MNTAAIKTTFLKINRALTAGLVVLIIISLTVLWLLDVDLEAQSTLLGSVLMVLAVVFYQIPRLAYRLTQQQFNQSTGVNEQILKQDWPAFRRWLDGQQ